MLPFQPSLSQMMVGFGCLLLYYMSIHIMPNLGRTTDREGNTLIIFINKLMEMIRRNLKYAISLKYIKRFRNQSIISKFLVQDLRFATFATFKTS